MNNERIRRFLDVLEPNLDNDLIELISFYFWVRWYGENIDSMAVNDGGLWAEVKKTHGDLVDKFYCSIAVGETAKQFIDVIK